MSRRFERAKPAKEIGRRIVIACEGKKTEPIYFNGMRASLRLPTLNVHVIKHEGSDPRSIVKAADEVRRELRLEKRWTADDTAWAVFDGDEHIANDPANWHEALQLAKGRTIHLAISNPCFELWYLLHFQDQSANLDRAKARILLKSHIPSYEKSLCLYPTPLQPYTQSAIQRAKDLRLRISRDELPDHNNPCSDVGLLVELILGLKVMDEEA